MNVILPFFFGLMELLLMIATAVMGLIHLFG
jgi:hypothetical protein